MGGGKNGHRDHNYSIWTSAIVNGGMKICKKEAQGNLLQILTGTAHRTVPLKPLIKWY
jgi:hypothetical protein